MIQTKQDLRDYIAADNEAYFHKSRRERLIGALALYPDHEIMRYKVFLRKAEYAFNTRGRSRLRLLYAFLWERRKNRLGEKLGIEIETNCFGKGLQIYHGAGIVVNPAARIGDYCALHGGNCIGNNGKTQAVPIIGDHADLGFGSCVLGDVRLADHITVGSGAIVVRSCETDGAVLIGVPAREKG